MKRVLRFSALILAVVAASGQTAKKAPNTDAEIKQAIINESIANYRGNCPCPYNTDRAGRSCGRRSAYSRPGGASPICYARDVTQKMLDDYRVRTKQ
jgi:hypothetical protein